MEDNLDAGFCQESVCFESFGNDLSLYWVANNDELNDRKIEQLLSGEWYANKAESF